MSIEIKTRDTRVELKSAQAGAGLVEAVICTFNKIDRDGDYVLPSAIEDGAEVVISGWNHSATLVAGGAPPVGKGIIRTDSQRAYLEGSFFMQNPRGREAFEIVRNMGAAQPWSWAFDITAASHGTFEGKSARVIESVEIYEASPVIRAASLGTGTTSAKELATAQFLRFLRSRARLSGVPMPTPATASREAEAHALAMQLRARYERSRFESSQLAAS